MLRRPSHAANYPDPHYTSAHRTRRHDYKTQSWNWKKHRRMLPNQEAIRLSLGRRTGRFGARPKQKRSSPKCAD